LAVQVKTLHSDGKREKKKQGGEGKRVPVRGAGGRERKNPKERDLIQRRKNEKWNDLAAVTSSRRPNARPLKGKYKEEGRPRGLPASLRTRTKQRGKEAAL